MNDYRSYFRDKKVTVMGLGLLGRGVGDAAFLAECGAKLTITDLKTKKELKESLDKLKKFKNIKYTLGEHRLADFRKADLILKGAGVPLDSVYLQEAKKSKIPVEMSATLFAKLSKLPIIAVTGTRGKSTTAHLIYHILKSAGKKSILGGNVRDISNLQLLKKTRNIDIAVFELDSWQLQGFGDNKISPHISVFTTFYPDHLGYYQGNLKNYLKDKSNIFRFQKKGDFLIIGVQAWSYIKKMKDMIKSKVIIAPENLPKDWKFDLPGAHNKYNSALAVEVAKILKISKVKIREALKTFTSLSGRLEFVKETKGVKIYNDNSSTTPEATIAALQAVGDKKVRKVVLIIGGDNKFLNMQVLLKEIPKFCSKIVLFKERGTNLIRDQVFSFQKKGIDIYEEDGLKNTVERAYKISQKGETILYSPAYSSFGKYFKNEYDRGDQFLSIVNELE